MFFILNKVSYFVINLLHFMKIVELLKKLWIPEKCSTIYISLLEHGDGKITDIAERTWLYRAYIYQSIPFLIEKNLIHSYKTGKQNWYRANNPETLKWLIANIENDIEWAIRYLHHHTKHENHDWFEYGQWIEMIQNAYSRQIEEASKDDIIYGYSSRKIDFEIPLLPDHIRVMRKQKRIGRKLITNPERIHKKWVDPYREMVHFPSHHGSFEHQISKSIHWDTVTVINYDTLEVFRFKNKHLAEFEKKIFEFLFEKLKK